MKDKIRPIYQELQGYLSQTPLPEMGYEGVTEASLWDQINQSIDELNEISSKNYDKFSISPKRSRTGDFIVLVAYRTKLGGLIDRLHAEYFSDEPRPFSGAPTTIITQEQTQEQSTQVVMLLEIQGKIYERLYNGQIGPKEKNFLEKLKESLTSIKSSVELINLILITAQKMGIDLENLIEIFK